MGLRKEVKELVQIIKNLEERIKILEKENENLKHRLLAYENPHTPSSKGGFLERPLIPDEAKKKNGQKNGHAGTTRPQAKPDKVIPVTAEKCYCGRKLGHPSFIEPRIVEEIPEPQPILVTQFDIAHYDCACGAHVVASHPDLPKEGRFGKNLLSHIAVLKFEDRLPHKKITSALIRDIISQ